MNVKNVYSSYRKPNITLAARFSEVKDPIDKQQQNKIIYEIPCKERRE